MMNKGFFAPPVPSFVIKIALGWELGEFLVLGGLRAIPEKLLRAGFEFEYPTLESMKEDFI
jgi:NAD dependent epimerase/dehydratase family enzyme